MFGRLSLSVVAALMCCSALADSVKGAGVLLGDSGVALFEVTYSWGSNNTSGHFRFSNVIAGIPTTIQTSSDPNARLSCFAKGSNASVKTRGTLSSFVNGGWTSIPGTLQVGIKASPVTFSTSDFVRVTFTPDNFRIPAFQYQSNLEAGGLLVQVDP